MARNIIESSSSLPMSLELELHKEAKESKVHEIDRRQGFGYDVVVLLRKEKGANHLFLALAEPEGAPLAPNLMLPEPIELPPPSDRVPNRVKDSLEHPMRYFAGAGIAVESFFAGHSNVEADAA